ncbi:glycosyltransferase [Paenibacillus sp. MZ04-78.2]|uniref:glycosyltransferase n=1 Tax=Paenibacillus sp. MZ04-78.2 TaxID=2962034 RepID=UPI0035CA5052
MYRKHPEITSQHDYEIIVVDNHSTDETVPWLRSQSYIKTIFDDENLGFPKACNHRIEVSSGDNILSEISKELCSKVRT